MNKSIDALKLALDALENLQGLCTDAEDGWVEAVTIWTPEAITAIREALAAQQQAGHTFYDGNGNVVAHLDATAEIKMDYSKLSAWSAPEQQPVERMTHDAFILAEDRPTSTDDNLYQWALDAEWMLRRLVKHINVQTAQQRLELIGHADLTIMNIHVFSEYGDTEIPENRVPLYVGYKK